MFKLRASGKLAIENLDRLSMEAFRTSYFLDAVRNGHENYIEPRVLQNLKISGKNSLIVSQNIRSRSGYLKHPIIIEGGTGELDYMDMKDPIFGLKDPTRIIKPNVRLWRLMEYGTSGNKYPIAPRTKSYLVFYWKKRNKLFVGKPGQSVMHPGFKGKGFFAAEIKSLYEASHGYYQFIEAGIKQLVKKYSA